MVLIEKNSAEELGLDLFSKSPNSRWFLYYSYNGTIKKPGYKGELHNPTEKRLSYPVYTEDGKTVTNDATLPGKVIQYLTKNNPGIKITKTILSSSTPSSSSNAVKPTTTIKTTTEVVKPSTNVIKPPATTTNIVKPPNTNVPGPSNPSISDFFVRNQKLIYLGTGIIVLLSGYSLISKKGKKKKGRK